MLLLCPAMCVVFIGCDVGVMHKTHCWASIMSSVGPEESNTKSTQQTKMLFWDKFILFDIKNASETGDNYGSLKVRQ